MEENVKVPFWQKTWVVVLACIFIPPAGIALLWIGKKGGMVIRIILTVVLGFYSLAWLGGIFGGGASKTTVQSTAQTETVTEQVAATENKKEEPVAPANSPKINMAEFTAIQNGMTYEEVAAIIGGPGTLSNEIGTAGEPYHTVTYTYEGEGDFGANAILSIQDGALSMKTQYGLK